MTITVERRRRCITKHVALSVLFFLSSLSINAATLAVETNVRPQSRLVDSIWQKVREAFEKTSHALSPQSGKKSADDSLSWVPRVTLSSERIALKSKSLQDHFQQFLSGNAAGLQNEHSRSLEAREISNVRETHRKVLRWRRVETSYCYFFSESLGSYWSYQWCPEKGVVLQGTRKRDGSVEPKHLVGTFVPFESMRENSDLDHPEVFVRSLQAKYRTAKVEVYNNGDPCGQERKRMAVVLHHENDSEFCAGDWTKSLTDLAIESVEEPYECAYIFNVCSGGNATKIAAMKTKHEEDSSIGQSVEDFDQKVAIARRTWRTYTVDSTPNMNRKMHPDRTTSLHTSLPPLPPSRIQSNLELVRDMFAHAYDSYMAHAFPASDIKPITCQPASFNLVRIPGLTLIDSLDTLLVMGNYTEFARAVERLRRLNEQAGQQFTGGSLFALDQNVSVFETNIRVLGGLLSAHQMAVAYSERKVLERNVWSEDKEVLIGPLPSHEEFSDRDTVKYWTYDDFLLSLARDLGDRLLPAFATRTGVPYGTVNLLSGVPHGETPIASLAGGGTLTLEMELLSRLTGNPEYGKAAKLATRALWMRRSNLDLLGKHICSDTGLWTEALSGIGSNSDSFYEYLAKHYFLFPEDSDFWLQLKSSYDGVFTHGRSGEWYGDVDFTQGGGVSIRRVFEALMAFYPGLQVSLGELLPAACSLNSFSLVREHLGFLPERFNYLYWRVESGGGHHFLRPELLESTYFVHRASKGFQQQNRNGTSQYWKDSSGWQWAGDFALHALEERTRTTCGYASLKNVSPLTTGDKASSRGSFHSYDELLNEMPSFFLSETLKYLYLLFDEDNILHVDTERDWVMTTEAHPIHHVEACGPLCVNDNMPGLKERLIRMLESRAGSSPREPSFVQPARFDDDKWTDSTSRDVYGKMLSKVKLTTREGGNARKSYGPDFWSRSELIQPVVPTSQMPESLDALHEVQRKCNPSHLTFGRLGLGNALKRFCPNFYMSDWLWIHALNGGMADYSEAYVSVAGDNLVDKDSRFHVTGSMESLALYGRGIHVAHLFWESDRATLEQQQDSIEADTTPEQQPSGNTVDLGGELGAFEVSAFAQGTGFVVKRRRTKETVITTLIQDESTGDPQTYVMVHSATPSIVNPNGGLDRTVVTADTYGNSFFCKVELILKRESGRLVDDFLQDVCREEDMIETTMGSYPCTPAMFGPVHMQELAGSDGLVLESNLIRRPHDSNKFGCNVGKGEEPFSTTTVVQETADEHGSSTRSINIVHRGQCSFEEKSFLQKKYLNAEAVVVINDVDDNLFVMSGGELSSPAGLDRDYFPPTVLIAGADGKELLSLTSTLGDLGPSSQLSTRISITRDRAFIMEETDGVRIQNSHDWPAVRVSFQDGITVFSRSGWGVRATARTKEGDPQSSEWQILIMPFQTVEP